MSNVLTASDFLSGGNAQLEEVKIPAIKKNGEPGVVFLSPLTTGEVLDFSTLPKDEQSDAMIRLMANHIVNEDGEPLFNEDSAKDLREVRADAFMTIQKAFVAIMTAITADSPAGEDSGATDG